VKITQSPKQFGDIIDWQAHGARGHELREEFGELPQFQETGIRVLREVASAIPPCPAPQSMPDPLF
jgi:hypothetical protein